MLELHESIRGYLSFSHHQFSLSLLHRFVCVVFEDVMVQTPVIDDELSPHWLPWTQRAFRFGIMHPSSVLYLGVFDYDLGITDHEAIGRVAINVSRYQRDTTYCLKFNLHKSSNVTDRTVSAVLRIDCLNIGACANLTSTTTCTPTPGPWYHYRSPANRNARRKSGSHGGF